MTFKFIKKLCTPAYVYLVISIVAIVILMFQNGGNENVYCVGSFECPVPSTALIFVFKFLYVAFWTFVLALPSCCPWRLSVPPWPALVFALSASF